VDLDRGSTNGDELDDSRGLASGRTDFGGERPANSRLRPDDRATLGSLGERGEHRAELFHERFKVSLTTLRASAS
jgi:hypothetical protein